jgi:stage II sporulation protein E
MDKQSTFKWQRGYTMENNDGIQVYERSPSSRLVGHVKGTRKHLLRGFKTSLADKVLTQDNFFLVASFLLGRALLFKELAPFGFAFWAVLYREKREICPTAGVFMLLGAYSGRSFLGVSSLMAGIVVMVVLEKFFESRRKKVALPLPLLAALGVAVGRIPLLAANSFIPYDYFLSLLEVTLVVPVTAFMLYGASLLWDEGGERPLRQEEVIGGLFFFAFILLGLAEGPAWLALLQGVILKTAVIILAYLYGGALGASSGLALGIFLGIGTYDYTYISLLAFAGLLGGIFREMGKVGTVMGFLIGILLCSFYLGGGPQSFEHMPAAMGASLLFFAMPAALLNKVKGFSPAFSLLTGNSKAEEEVRHMTSRRLKDLSRVFHRIAAAFQDVVVDKENPEALDVAFFNRLGQEACRQCGSYQACWQDGFNVTYSSLRAAMVERGPEKISMRDLPFPLRQRCRYQSRLLKNLNQMLEQYRLEHASRKCLQEGRVMVASQLEGLSTVINDLSNEIKLKLDCGVQEAFPGPYNFTLEIGVSQLPKQGQEVSGDYYSLLTLKEGKQVIILSDGMGSGPKAKEESKSTVNLLEDLLESGFSRELVFKTVNTVMQLRSAEETYSTVDLCLIDLQEGKAEISKIGAAPSFIRRGEQVKEISASSLPLGILSHIEMESKTERLQDGDILVIVSDGVSEAGVRVNNSANWIKKKIQEVNYTHPQLVADTILQEGLRRNGGQALDDMSIIVCKVLRLRGN